LPSIYLSAEVIAPLPAGTSPSPDQMCNLNQSVQHYTPSEFSANE
jgi:hypothetical protein